MWENIASNFYIKELVKDFRIKRWFEQQMDFDEEQISKTGRISWGITPKEPRYRGRGDLRNIKKQDKPRDSNVSHNSKEEIRENFREAKLKKW